MAGAGLDIGGCFCHVRDDRAVMVCLCPPVP